MPETTSTPEADNVDKIDPRELAENVAAMAIMAYVIADLPGKLPRGGVRPARGNLSSAPGGPRQRRMTTLTTKEPL